MTDNTSTLFIILIVVILLRFHLRYFKELTTSVIDRLCNTLKIVKFNSYLFRIVPNIVLKSLLKLKL